MRTLQRVGAGLLVLTLAGGTAACGSDDDDATDTTEAPGSGGGEEASGDNAAFCDGVAEFNTAVFEVELEEDTPEEDVIAAGEMLAPLATTLVDNAPDDLADVTAEVNDFIQPLKEGDAAPFNEDATFEIYSSFLSDAVDACEFDTVDVTGVDYAFEDVPETIEAGTVAFKFTNAAESEEHEMIVFRRADGVTLGFEELLELGEEESAEMIEFKTAAFAPPGGEGATLAELDPGAYAMVCFLPVGGGEEGPPHFTQGMIQEFAVE